MKRYLIIFLIFLTYFNNALGQATIKDGRFRVHNYTETLARQYFDTNIESLDPIEGIWLHDGWKYSIEKNFDGKKRDVNTFRVVIIEVPRNVVWHPNEIQFFLHKGASNIFEVAYFAFIAKWTNGQRKYGIEPVKGIAVQDGINLISMKLPDFDDLGNTTGYSVQQFIKLYPEITSATKEYKESQESAEWSGTGFALKNGYIVTNYHVIEGAKKIIINGIKGSFNTIYDAEVVGTDKINDLALLKITDSSFPGFGNIPYSVAASTSEVGEEVFVLGYPLTSTMGDEIKLTTGIISSKTGYQGDVALYQISAPIQPGNSGGPLFDKKGNIIGIVSAKHEGAENVGYAIKATYLRNLIESCASPSIIPSTNSVASLPLTGKVKSEKNFVFFIQCTK